MGKTKKLIKNTIIFSISQFASKLLNFLLVPFYTSYLSTADYGTADYINTIIMLLIAILPLSIHAAVLRFILKNTKNLKSYFSLGIVITFCSLIVFLFGLPIYWNVTFIRENIFIFILTYFAYINEQLIDSFLQAIDKIFLLGVTGIIKTVIILLLNIWLIVTLKLGVKGYLYSYTFGILFVLLLKILLIKIWKYFSFKSINKETLKEMLSYSIPMIPNSVSWWLTNSLNKIILTNYCSVAQLGLYTVASKIPFILTTLQNMVSSALNLSVFEEYSKSSPEENRSYYTTVFSLFIFIFVLATSFLIMFVKVFAVFMFKSDFFIAWKYVPVLLIGSLLGIISGFLGTFYFASLKTKGVFYTTLVGAIVSIILNFILIPIFAINGTVISTAIASFIILILRLIFVMKNKFLNVNIFWLFAHIVILSFQAVLTQINYNCYIIGIISIFLIFIFNFNKILLIKNLILNYLNKRKDKEI